MNYIYCESILNFVSYLLLIKKIFITSNIKHILNSYLQKQQVQTNTNTQTQTTPTSWIIGGDDRGTSESLVTLNDGRLCGTLLPSLPGAVYGMSAGYSAGRVYICGGNNGKNMVQ